MKNITSEQITMLKDKVEYVLKHHPASRSCDKYLAVALWYKFYNNFIIEVGADKEKAILLKNIVKLPSQELIARCRRKFQESNLYLPTLLNVAKKRKIQEQVWRDYMLKNNFKINQ